MSKVQMQQLALSTIALAMSAGLAQAQLHDGVRTIFLQSGGSNWGAPMNVAYDPGRDLYYTGGGGFPANDATVLDGNGNIVSTNQVPADLRSWFYNPNTGNLELVSYNAVGGGGDYGFFTCGRDGSGYLDGTKTLVLANMSGLNGSQTMPAFDPVANVLYSGTSGSTTVNKVDRATGSLISTISCTGGPGSNGGYSVGYDGDENWLMLFDSTGSRVMVYDGTSGAYIGSAAVDLTYANYGFGYANKQVWVYDSNRNGWQGYDIGAGGGSAYRCSITGSCPGTVNVAWSGAQPSQQQYIIFAGNTGSVTIPNGPCSGTVLGLGAQNIRLVNTISTGSGSSNVNGQAGTGACGGYLQLVTIANPCETSNVAQLP
jgi:hypothetical protein